MATNNSPVHFVYINPTGSMPANPDPNTIYFLESAQKLYVGSHLIADHTTFTLDTDVTLSVAGMAADSKAAGDAVYGDKSHTTNSPACITYFDINRVFSTSNPAGPRDIPINSYCSAYGSILAGFNNSLFTLDIELEYNVFQITNLSTLTHNRSKIYILNAEEKQFYVADFRTSSGSVFYYDLSLKNYMSLPSTATSGDFLVYNGSEWAAQTVPAANGNDF